MNNPVYIKYFLLVCMSLIPLLALENAPSAFLLQAFAVGAYSLSTEESEKNQKKTEDYIKLILPFYMVFLVAVHPTDFNSARELHTWIYEF